ncbi:hypothetical protein [Streptomyces showdoensis]|uniref:hypothetical protein n=1 Tax=Streptomyces showdoensis TaxID=68268 RepID=UPI001039969E|nr:hypothetical protein [Streptomyces showdoensis]
MKTTGRVIARWVCAGAGIWVAAEVVDRLRVAPDVAGLDRVVAVAVVAAVLTAAVALVPLPLQRWLGRAVAADQRRLAEEFDNGSDARFLALIGRQFAFAGLGLLLSVFVIAVVGPVGLWAGIKGAAGLGFDVELGGGAREFVAAALVVAAVQRVLLLVLDIPVKRRTAAALRALAGYLACLGGLALAVLWLDGVTADTPQWTALTVVVAVFQLRPVLSLALPLPGVASFVLVTVNALVLGLIAWLTGLLDIAGFWPLAGTAALMWAAEWPVRLVSAVAEARRNRQSPQPPPDPFWPDSQMPHAPLY